MSHGSPYAIIIPRPDGPEDARRWYYIGPFLDIKAAHREAAALKAIGYRPSIVVLKNHVVTATNGEEVRPLTPEDESTLRGLLDPENIPQYWTGVLEGYDCRIGSLRARLGQRESLLEGLRSELRAVRAQSGES